MKYLLTAIMVLSTVGAYADTKTDRERWAYFLTLIDEAEEGVQRTESEWFALAVKAPHVNTDSDCQEVDDTVAICLEKGGN